jgi:hypothetical protein
MDTKTLQDYFLLSINPNRGSYYNMGNEFFYGLMAAMVVDLYSAEKIGFKLKYITLNNQQATGFVFFDRAIQLIGNRKYPIKAYGLISRLGFRSRSYKKEIVNNLLGRNLIIRVRKKFLFIPYNRYFPADRDARLDLVRRMRDILLRNDSWTNDEFKLLILIHATGLYRALSDQRAERKLMRQRMKVILKNDRNEAIDQNLVLLGDVLKRSIISANAAQHAATT